MIDRYTKIVLTVTAAALVALALDRAIPRAIALNDGCGTYTSPCYITTGPLTTIRVSVH